MRVLVACEFSGTVAQAFRDRGHDAWSCDLLPSLLCKNTDHVDGAGDCCGHYIGDVSALLVPAAWDLMIAHPPCTYLSVSGMHRTVRGLRSPTLTEDALAFVRLLLDAPDRRDQ